MSRTRSRGRSTSTRRNAVEEVAIIDDLAFQPTAVCGGRLSTSDYNLRSRKCTEDQLERLKATAEFKAWERERGAGAGPSWAARLEQAKALLPPSLVPYSKTIAIVSIITLLLVVPMLFPLAMKSSSSGISAPAAVKKGTATSSSSVRTPVAAPVTTPQQKKSTEDTVKKPSKPATVVNSEEKERALQTQITKAKNAAAAAQEQQRQLVVKLEEASKREAALVEENKRLTEAIATKKSNINKSNLQKAFTISGSGRGEALKTPSFPTGKNPKALLQYAVYYLTSLGPDVGLLTIEAGLLVLAAVLMVGLRKSRREAEQVKKEYLLAYSRQVKMFAKAETAYEAAYSAQSVAEKMVIEARKEAASGSTDATAASDAAAEAAVAAATALKEQELQAKEQRLEKRVEEIKASADAQTSAWAAAAAQLLQLAGSSPNKNKNNKNQPQQKSRLSKSSTPPSPGTVVTAVTDKYSQLRVRLTTAETAATDAAIVADVTRREREHSEQRVSEMITDNELLKERLADTKKALAVATDAKAAAELHEAEVRAALETAQRNLATVQSEKKELMKEAETLKESLKTASDKVAAAVKGGGHLEAQVEQLTVSLGDESAQKQRTEQRCAQLENDLSALQILADGLQNQVSALEQRLDESLAAQSELKSASKQLEAAHAAAVAAASASSGSPALVQRALNEESAALQRLSTAERRATEAFTLSGGEDVAPRPALPRSIAYPPCSPQQINSARASSLIARAGKIASMLSEGMDGLLGGASPSGANTNYTRSYDASARNHSTNPTAQTSGAISALSALSARGENGQQQLQFSARRRSIDSSESGAFSARMSRASELFAAAEQYLGQELPNSSSSYYNAAEKRPYRDIPLLLGDADAVVKVNGIKESLGEASTMSRFVAAVNESMKDAETLKSALRAQGTPLSSAAADRLSAAQSNVAAALEIVETTSQNSEEMRSEHAFLASVAREKQRALEDAQLALTAAMEEDNSGSNSSGSEAEAAVAAAAHHLQIAEKAQQTASEAVYKAERDMYDTLSAKLKAQEHLRREQEVMMDAFTAATDILNGGDKALDAHALTVSPRLPLGLKSAPTDVFG